MRVITDIHLHSKWSRSCSPDLTLPNIARMCEIKGVNLVGTADALHPAWRKDIALLLQDAGEGTFALKKDISKTRFILSTEISCIYKKNDKVRRIHHILLFPTLRALDIFTISLNKRECNLRSDGRPIVGLTSEEILKYLLDADPSCMLIPAHAWTPWYAIFGSKSGFDSIQECFGDLSKYIYAIETGLSSNPKMNRRLSQLDSMFLVSNSDAHSCENIGREANVFEMSKSSYTELFEILSTHQTKKFLETYEFFPEEGKYFADGHAMCNFFCNPSETKKLQGICPICKKKLIIGVQSRVEELADRKFLTSETPFRSFIPLPEIISYTQGVNKKSVKVKRILEDIRTCKKSEFDILLHASETELKKIMPTEVVKMILHIRLQKINWQPGYDGVYGKII